MTIISISAAFIILFIFELVYFRIASHYKIVDIPNHRSSHNNLTIRGGGIVFTIGLLLYPVYFGLTYKYFLLGLFLIAFISFVDDIKTISNKIRIFFHLAAVSLMFYQLEFFNLPFYWVILALIFVIGSINAINFMDGINGITGSYALITLCTLLYINVYLVEFVVSSFLITSIISVIIFNFFNFRIKAKCFAGDVGSVSIAFIIIFFILQLIIKTENFNYLLLLLFYGLDTVSTIIFRLIRKENIFDAHRSHFYQYLANEKKISHLAISTIYAVGQVLFNLIIIKLLPATGMVFFIILFFNTIIFVTIRFYIEGSSKLLGR
ncbi:UDP-N-acetylmuramyl pentapeptide phosphotransferase/UDP-N-acetylglucosamine-1-phosphate transferase [Pedobacter cryoconitis]|uniref:UDP-GlcNAc--UDP-phosphate GlcNAc-1-phosphate transferase n=1 Tax=Pedobacter cryoconitis TaxID=188932 RepID=UPI001615833B|nr:UDP-GlcNAc--UDP-phosphate GlcNAc-1-phosphate transferase [Pedobacter cryoconitis]MBB6271527.1 UDP-N-acetylmuramyl pentapeptide phosphotransferase/UDP-N-acetylglucosamine-1-phosphate transferase [Pedobacter cryoconitis]